MSEPIAATPISSAPPPFTSVQLNPSKDSAKDTEGTLANPEEITGAEEMEQKAEEVAAQKSKARARDSESKGKWWPCTTKEIELRNLEAEEFLQPGSWRTTPGELAPAPEAGEWVVTKALIERGFSLPPSDFFIEILQAYQLQPHNISPNSILAISNHVTLCEGHLRVTPDLLLFQYFFSVKKEKVSQTSSLATCGSITFKLRPGRVYPQTDRHESVRYWSGGFFYLKDVSDPASKRVLPEFKNSPASETPAWTQCPHLSESPLLTRAIRRICKLTEEGLSGKEFTMSWFTKRIQPLQHRDRLMFHYTGRDDLMRVSKDNLSADTLDKRIRVLIKVLRDLHVHECNVDIHMNGSGTALEALEEKDLETLTRTPHAGTNDPDAASNTEAPAAPAPAKRKRAAPAGPAAKCARETPSAAATRRAEKEKQRLKQIDTSKQCQPNIDQFFMTSSKSSGSKLPKNPKKKAKPSPASMPLTPEVEVPPKATSSTPPNPKDVIDLDDLPEEPNAESSKGESGKGASSSHPPPEQPDNMRKLHEDLRVLVLEQKVEIEGLHTSYAESQKAISILETRVKKHEEDIASLPSIKEISADLKVMKAERDSLQKFLKESAETETKMKRELEEKHAQEVSDLAEKLKKSNQRIKTLAAKNRAYETEAESIDKMIFRKDFSLTEAYEDAWNSIDDIFEACHGIAKSLNLKRAGTTLIDRMTKLMRMVLELIKDWQASSARGVASLTLATCKAHFPAMDFASVARGVPKGTNIMLTLAETQGYDRLLAERVNHSFWYNKYDLPEGFSNAEEDEEAEEGSGSSANHASEDDGGDSGDGSAYVASEEDEDYASE
ncbi:hypothetical protein QYE76_001483 [Lolium multiflorum]|uniref:Transposase (putative) gypsy type domain-containing protein n=1 Tax=Lolium multiflorum TaxID=4521 RepID=A0AAD8VZE7_LOLMU|nr:hypothetical protein QYE76_001483 [Lolium multiflorum]